MIKILNIFLLAFPPVLFWGYFYYVKDSREPEPLKLLIKAFVFGMIVAGLFVAVAYIFERYEGIFVLNAAWMFIVLAFFEEFAKLGVLMKLTKYRAIDVDQIVDGVIYAVCIALGFAFVENVYYFAQYIAFAEKGAELYGTYLVRGFGTMLAHTIFSGIAGYYYVLGKVKKKPLWIRGLIYAAVMHVLFNYFMSASIWDFNLAYLNVVLLGGSLWFLLWLIRNKKAEKIRNIK
ncbi:PrsW family intramembrane metalloprotease [Patescibacteria group bacterium]